MSLQHQPTTDRLIRLPEVKALTGLQRSTIYAQIQKGAFPKAVKVSDRAVAWRESDIQGWIRGLQTAAIGGNGGE